MADAVYEGKAGDVLLGGVNPEGDGFRVVFEVHRPCRGDNHRGCTIVETYKSLELVPTREAALEALDACRQDLIAQGIADWQAEGPSA